MNQFTLYQMKCCGVCLKNCIRVLIPVYIYSDIIFVSSSFSFREVLENLYGLKRWQIGEIASKIGQLYYHY